MAATGAPQTTSPEPATAYVPKGRDKLASLVVVGSFLTLFALVVTLVFLAQSDNTGASEAAKNAFTAVLPVLAGWVGTVLAFYFSAASQERTSASLDKVISQSGSGPGPSAPVSSKMIPYSSVAGLQDLGKTKPSEITIEALQKAFEATLPNGAKVSRLLFVENGVFKYVLHIGTLNAFIVKNPAGKTFADMLLDDETLRQISKLVVFVAANATLGDAKAALDKVSGAQDIIVTGSGSSTEPMLGWLSNVDLTKALQVI
jgi:hypothetical protein